MPLNGPPIWEFESGQEPKAGPAESCRWTPLPMLQRGRERRGRGGRRKHGARLCVIGRYCSAPAVQGYGMPSKLGHRSMGRARSTGTQDKKGMSRPSLCLLVLLLSHAAILFAAAAPFLVKCLSCAIRRPPSPPIPRRPHPLPHRPNHIATLEPPGKPPVDAVQGFISCAQPSVHPWTPGPSQLFSLELQTSQSFSTTRLLLSPPSTTTLRIASSHLQTRFGWGLSRHQLLLGSFIFSYLPINRRAR